MFSNSKNMPNFVVGFKESQILRLHTQHLKDKTIIVKQKRFFLS